MDTIINILDFIGILTIIYSIAIYVYIDNIYKAGGYIKDLDDFDYGTIIIKEVVS